MLSAKPLSWRLGAPKLAAATLVALAAVLAAYAAVRLLVGDLLVDGPRGITPVTPGAVALATVVGGLAALLLARLAARTRRPHLWFAVGVGIGLIASSVPPLTAAVTMPTAGWLLLLHVVVAVPLLGVAWRTLPQRPHQTDWTRAARSDSVSTAS